MARHYPCSQTWSEGSDAEWSDDEKDEIWSEQDSDDDSYCPYQPLTLDEALEQIEDGKKTRLAGKSSDNPRLHELGYAAVCQAQYLMSGSMEVLKA